MKLSIVSGGFDPLHSGHIAYLEAAANLGDELWVCLNSDAWLTEKKGKPFMPFEERKAVLQALNCVTAVIDFEDHDGSCINGIEKIKALNPNTTITFCNGGDRTIQNIPERDIENIEFAFGVGGVNKKNSSSIILENWRSPSETRTWGKYSILFNNNNIKVKELVIDSKNGMSFQRHFKRHEIWFIHRGKCEVHVQASNSSNSYSKVLKYGDLLTINIGDWHQITNPFLEECKIIEIQYGSKVIEEDIERQFFYPNTP